MKYMIVQLDDMIIVPTIHTWNRLPAWYILNRTCMIAVCDVILYNVCNHIYFPYFRHCINAQFLLCIKPLHAYLYFKASKLNSRAVIYSTDICGMWHALFTQHNWKIVEILKYVLLFHLHWYLYFWSDSTVFLVYLNVLLKKLFTINPIVNGSEWCMKH